MAMDYLLTVAPLLLLIIGRFPDSLSKQCNFNVKYFQIQLIQPQWQTLTSTVTLTTKTHNQRNLNRIRLWKEQSL